MCICTMHTHSSVPTIGIAVFTLSCCKWTGLYLLIIRTYQSWSLSPPGKEFPGKDITMINTWLVEQIPILRPRLLYEIVHFAKSQSWRKIVLASVVPLLKYICAMIYEILKNKAFINVAIVIKTGVFTVANTITAKTFAMNVFKFRCSQYSRP